MQSYTELTPPTAVTHSLSLPFLSATANNLIVVKTSLLQIFSLKAVTIHTTSDVVKSAPQSANPYGPEPPSPSFSSAATRGERVQSTKLVLVAQYELSGTVTSLARVKIGASRSGGQALLLAFRDAKLSLIEWDPERYSISTISIHSYEQEDIQSSPWEPALSQSATSLSVDPRSRCAALRFGARHLAILPFYQEGDDLVMGDLDSDAEEEHPAKAAGESFDLDRAPYAPSFVLSLLALDPSLSHPVHLAFLNEYREPTFGILSSQNATSSALLRERRDPLSYTVFTLDLEQRASTTLLSVNSLPYDLFQVYPLPLPVGGALLIGTNELIHVDQSGKTNGVAVNDLTKQCTSFGMLDQSSLGLRLEGCIIEKIGSDNGDMLIILNDGSLALLSFKTDGRSVSSLSVQRLAQEMNGLEKLASGVSSISVVGRGRIFVGSEDGDSVILGWQRKVDKLKRQRSHPGLDADLAPDASDVEDDVEDDEDDLYASAKPAEQNKSLPSPSSIAAEGQEYIFRIHDCLENFGPMKDINVTRSASNEMISVMIATGRGQSGSLSAFTRELLPQVSQKFDLQNAEEIWTICFSEPNELSLTDLDAGYDRFLVANIKQDAEIVSSLYSISATKIEKLLGSDFDNGQAGDPGASIDIGRITLASEPRLVQILSREVRTFDIDFNVVQILPLMEDEPESNVVNATFMEPFVLLILDDSKICVLGPDDMGTLDVLEQGKRLLDERWISGSLYDDTNDIFRLQYDDVEDEEAGHVMMFLLTSTGGLHVYRLPNLTNTVYVAEGLSFIPPFLSQDFGIRRSTARETLTEVMVTDLGDSTHKAPYLLLRSINDDIIIYQPYQGLKEADSPITLRFLKLPNPYVPNLPADVGSQTERQRPLRAIADLGGYSSIYVPGQTPCFILKTASSPVRLFPLGIKGIGGLKGINTNFCEQGIVYIEDDMNITTAQLPVGSHYGTGWITTKIPFGEQIEAFDYHSRTDSYAVGTSKKADYKLSADDSWTAEDTAFLPQVEQGFIKLMDRKTSSLIDNRPLDIGEVIMSIKTMSLETSEHTHERKSLIVVGTAIIRGEDLPAVGRIYVFDIIDVVPEPDRPETGKKFKLIAREEVKGAVTALSEIGTQGFLLAAQGQKCMVRGLKEDNSLLPVAFMDMQCYVSAVKELRGTGLCVMGDAIKGIWFAGYHEDPYQLRLFGKSSKHIEVLAVDFLPDGKQLYIVAADTDCNIHVLQFDPENPKSLSGQHLLPISTFHTGHFPTSLTLLPPTPSPSPSQPHSLLLTTSTGALSLLTPLPPSSHRTLSALQSHLQNTLPQPCGLNPRIYRHVGDIEGRGGVVDGMGSGVGARGGVVDGMVVRRWNEGGSWRRWGDEGSVRGVVGGVVGGF